VELQLQQSFGLLQDKEKTSSDLPDEVFFLLTRIIVSQISQKVKSALEL